MTTNKPTQHLLLISPKGQASTLTSSQDPIESPQRCYHFIPFTHASLPIALSAVVLWVSAKRSVTKSLRDSLQSMRARGVTPPILVYLDEAQLFQGDLELLDLIEQEVRALLEEVGLAANEVSFFHGEAHDTELFLTFLDHALAGRDTVLEGSSLLAQALCSISDSTAPAGERLLRILRELHPGPLPRYWLEMLEALKDQQAKTVELGFACDWSFFQALSQASALLPFHCDLYPYAVGGNYPYTPRRTFYMVYQDMPLAVLLSSSSYVVCEVDSLGMMGNKREFLDAQELSTNHLFTRCQEERLPIQGSIFKNMRPKDNVVWMVKALHNKKLSDRTLLRTSAAQGVGLLGTRKDALSGLGRPSSKLVTLLALEEELRLLLAPWLTSTEGVVPRLLELLSSLFSQGDQQLEARAWYGSWSYLVGGGNRLWTVTLPKKKWVVTLFFDDRSSGR
jgi:hypothetical protein